mmetsp:Transcript_16996/g.49096  ORF Transcript_16996/g.49096 Transcript_16996/m.49096 type:complete len:331 (-) Transcript_16996:441-1433(-)
MLTIGSLARKHDAVSTVEDGVGNIGTLGAGRTGVGDHRFEHLSGSDNRLASNVGLADHVLLREEDLLRGDLHAQVTAGNHNGVSRGEDLGVILKSLEVLDLADDLDVPVLLPEDLTDLVHIRRLPDEGGGNVVGTVLACPVLNVVNVLLSEGGQVDDDSGEVHVLALADGGIIIDTAVHLPLIDLAFKDCEDERAVGDENLLPLLHGGGEGRVRARELAVAPLEGVVSGESEGLALDEVDFLPLGEESRADLGTLCVEHDGHMDPLVGSGGPQPIQTGLVPVVISVGKVESRHGEAGVDETLELLHLPACRSQRAHDLGVSRGYVRRGDD